MQNHRLLAPSHKRGQFTYKVTVTAAQATTPLFTFAAGAPAAVVDWGDGTARSAVTSGVELNHAYTVGGTYTVKLIAPNQAKYLTAIDLNADKVVSVLTPIQMFPNLAFLPMNDNTAWAQNIGSWILLPLLAYFKVTNSPVVGNVSSLVLPSGLAVFFVSFTNFSGSANSLVIPAGMTFYLTEHTAITGVPILTSMVSIHIITANDCALPQASVDLWLSRCVAVEAQTTFAAPTLNLGGTNQAPSAAGLVNRDILVAAGWTVTVTA